MPKVAKRRANKPRQSTKKTISPEAMHEMIQKKAYELFEKRGYSQGSEWSDWLEAEKIIKSGKYE